MSHCSRSIFFFFGDKILGPTATQRRKEIIWLTIPGHSPSSREVKVGTQRWKPSYCSTQCYLWLGNSRHSQSSGGRNHGGCSLLTGRQLVLASFLIQFMIIGLGNGSFTVGWAILYQLMLRCSPTDLLIQAIPQFRFSSQIILGCIKLINKAE